MARSTNGSSDKISCGSITGLALAVNASYSGWMYRAAVGTTAGFGAYIHPNRFSVVWYSDNFMYFSIDNGVNESYGATSQIISGWHHVVCVYNGAGVTNEDRLKVYVNGISPSLSYISVIPTTLGNNPSWEFGRDNVSGDRFWAGAYAECGIWNVTLTAAEAISLGQGLSPLSVRPSSLLAYWPLVGHSSPERELINRFEGVLTGTSLVDHPRVTYQTTRRKTLSLAAPGPQTPSPIVSAATVAAPTTSLVQTTVQPTTVIVNTPSQGGTTFTLQPIQATSAVITPTVATGQATVSAGQVPKAIIYVPGAAVAAIHTPTTTNAIILP